MLPLISNTEIPIEYLVYWKYAYIKQTYFACIVHQWNYILFTLEWPFHGFESKSEILLSGGPVSNKLFIQFAWIRVSLSQTAVFNVDIKYILFLPWNWCVVVYIWSLSKRAFIFVFLYHYIVEKELQLLLHPAPLKSVNLLELLTLFRLCVDVKVTTTIFRLPRVVFHPSSL